MAVSQPNAHRTHAISQDILLTYGVYSREGQSGASSGASTGRLETRQNKRYLGSLAVVIESVGGDRATATASSTLVAQLVRSYFGGPQEDPLANLQQAISSANATSYAASVRAGQDGQLGAKVLAAAIVGQQAHIVSVGDLRAYLVHDGQATSITRAIIQTGQSGESAVFLGRGAGLPIPFTGAADGRFSFQQTLAPGDALVLCNDNLARALRSADIARLAIDAPAAQAARQLVEQAGQPDDNMTAAVIQYGAARASAIPRWMLGVAAVCLLALFALWSIWLMSGTPKNTSPSRTPVAGTQSVASGTGPILSISSPTAETPSGTATSLLPTSILQPTNTPAPSATPTPSATPAPPTPTPVATPAPIPNVAVPTSAATFTPDIAPTAIPEPSASPTATFTLASTPTQTATSTASTTPSNTATPTPEAQLVVNPEQGTLGETFTVSGSGFAASEKIDLWLTAPDGKSMNVSTDVPVDENGSLHPITFVINKMKIAPNSRQPGTWGLAGRGKKSARLGNTTFVVRPGDEPAQVAHLMLDSDITFTKTITVTGSNFAANETVSLWLTSPEGKAIRISEKALVDEKGMLLPITFIISEIAPNSPSGTWGITGEGNQSKRKAMINFVVKP